MFVPSAASDDDVPSIGGYSPFIDVCLADGVLDRYADVVAYPPSRFSADARSIARMVRILSCSYLISARRILL